MIIAGLTRQKSREVTKAARNVLRWGTEFPDAALFWCITDFSRVGPDKLDQWNGLRMNGLSFSLESSPEGHPVLRGKIHCPTQSDVKSWLDACLEGRAAIRSLWTLGFGTKEIGQINKVLNQTDFVENQRFLSIKSDFPLNVIRMKITDDTAQRQNLVTVDFQQLLNEVDSRIREGDVLLHAKRYSEAETCFDNALQLQPTNKSALVKKALATNLQKNLDRSQQLIELTKDSLLRKDTNRAKQYLKELSGFQGREVEVNQLNQLLKNAEIQSFTADKKAAGFSELAKGNLNEAYAAFVEAEKQSPADQEIASVIKNIESIRTFERHLKTIKATRISDGDLASLKLLGSTRQAFRTGYLITALPGDALYPFAKELKIDYHALVESIVRAVTAETKKHRETIQGDLTKAINGDILHQLAKLKESLAYAQNAYETYSIGENSLHGGLKKLDREVHGEASIIENLTKDITAKWHFELATKSFRQGENSFQRGKKESSELFVAKRHLELALQNFRIAEKADANVNLEILKGITNAQLSLNRHLRPVDLNLADERIPEDWVMEKSDWELTKAFDKNWLKCSKVEKSRLVFSGVFFPQNFDVKVMLGLFDRSGELKPENWASIPDAVSLKLFCRDSSKSITISLGKDPVVAGQHRAKITIGKKDFSAQEITQIREPLSLLLEKVDSTIWISLGARSRFASVQLPDEVERIGLNLKSGYNASTRQYHAFPAITSFVLEARE